MHRKKFPISLDFGSASAFHLARQPDRPLSSCRRAQSAVLSLPRIHSLAPTSSAFAKAATATPNIRHNTRHMKILVRLPQNKTSTQPLHNHRHGPTTSPQTPLHTAEEQVHALTNTLYKLTVQSYSYSGPETSSAMRFEVNSLVKELKNLDRTAKTVDLLFPNRILQFVEEGRNPDILTRQYIEGVQEKNQQLKGRAEAFGRFAETLAEEMREGLPELEGDVDRVLKSVKKVG